MIHFQVYSSEKYKNTGNGIISHRVDPKRFNGDSTLIHKEIERIKDEQKRINRSFKDEGRRLQYGVNSEVQDTVVNNKIKYSSPLRAFSSKVNLDLDEDTGNSTVIFGSGKRGKTKLLLYLYLKYYNNSRYINTLFCMNPQIKEYNKFKLKYKGFDSDATDLIKSHQYLNSQVNNKYEFVEFFDDIVTEKNKPILNELVLTYRNSNISCMILLQYIYLLSKMNRATINNVFIFGFNTDEACREIIKTYLEGHFNKMGYTTEDSRLAFFKEITDNHGFIYVKPQTNNISFHRLILNKK